jgi:hypothetical protein
MALPKRRQDPNEPDLTSLSDFQLLNSLAEHCNKERSHALLKVAWEIMRRYTAHSGANAPEKVEAPNPKLGDARWGDAKRAEIIFGLKRGVLNSLSAANLIISKSLDDGRNGKRAKRLYDLVSIQDYLNSIPC